jgi:hypothetical protein
MYKLIIFMVIERITIYYNQQWINYSISQLDFIEISNNVELKNLIK